MAAEGQSDRMASDMEVQMEQRCAIECLTDSQRFLLIFCGNQSVDVSIVRWWVVHFSSSDSDMHALVHHW